MKYKKYRHINRIASEWKTIYNDNITSFTPFQGYTSNRIYDRVFKYDYVRLFCKKLFYYVEEGENRVIIPLIINPIKKNVRDFATFSPIDYYDMLSNTSDVMFLRKALASVISNYTDYEICLSRFSSNSILKKVIPEEIEMSRELCAEIILNGSYDDYYSSLSKHQRQNIRTAYNHMTKAGIGYRIEKYQNGNIPNGIWRECRKMYEDRCNVKDGVTIKRLFNLYKRLSNPINRVLLQIEDNATYVLFFGDEPVAFMSGFYNRDFSKYYVPRLSCSNKYYYYDTGIILLNEVVKIFCSEGVGCIDLTRGGEPYKFAMGGIPHYNYSFHEKGSELASVLASK